MKRSQEYLAQDGIDRPCHLPRLPVGLLTPQIYLLHLKVVSSVRDLPGSPPCTDTHPLPARAQVSLNPLSISWAFQLRFHQTVSTPQNVLSVPGSGVEAGLQWREDACGLSWGLTLSSGLPDASHNIPASSPDLLDSFLFSRRSCQISAFSRNPKLCGIQDSDSPPHASTALPQAVIQTMEFLPLQ